MVFPQNLVSPAFIIVLTERLGKNEQVENIENMANLDGRGSKEWRCKTSLKQILPQTISYNFSTVFQ